MKSIISQQLRKKRTSSMGIPPVVIPPTINVNNQLEEIEYFNAYYLPIEEKENIQTALDTYGSVRLGVGNYSGTSIVIHSNQKLYGSPSFKTIVPQITVASGSSGVVLMNLFPFANQHIILESGGLISNCTFKSIKWSTLTGINVMFANNTIIDYQGNINIDCSGSGYFRNNKIIRHQTGGSPSLIMKGNTITPSYGNVNLWSNFLTPHGDTTDINQLESATFVGIDAEGWNLNNLGTKAMFYARNTNNIKLADLNGSNAYVATKTPTFDVDSDDFFILNRGNYYPTDIASTKTNMFLVGGRENTYLRQQGTVTGFDLWSDLENDYSVDYNGARITAPINNPTDITKITSAILGPQYTPWARPVWETLPDPLGANWKADRIGKPDSRAYIQNLIDTNKIAELPEGIFYIGATLLLPANNTYGILGKGTGKTVICALTDDFPLISLTGGSGANGSIVLSYLTLQGGNSGLYGSHDYGILFMAYQNMKFVVFRNMINAIHLNQMGGFDNNFIENIAFINCDKGFYKYPEPNDYGEQNSTYVDKTTFYNCQFINCNTAVHMRATRADNLNAWINCKFDGGNQAFNLRNSGAPIIANSDIKNYVGEYILDVNAISMYNTNVYDNVMSKATITSPLVSIEGCNLLDNDDVFIEAQTNIQSHHILNSTITGNAIVVRSGGGVNIQPQNAIFINSNLLANPTFSKVLVNLKDGVGIIVLDTTPTPYPQLLVTQ